jgi:NAD(P)-dependent dehydrogenase (short-subunit alcohol dehydrogenase family)
MLQNPTTKYPKPPFDSQFQPWPGLASKMSPRPDHGETSYKGSGRLAGRKALITGGDSGMGRAAAIAYAREGADVAINYYPTEEPDALEVIQLIKDAGHKAIAFPAINGVAPGPIWTPLQVSGGQTQEKLKEFGKQTPLGRPGQPAELASIYVQLAADDARYATGQIYGSAGGSGQP